MMQEEITGFLHALCDVAQKETLPRFRAHLETDNKNTGSFDPVTEADKQAELAIRNAIGERFPDHGIIGEEYGSEAGNEDYCWIIDPIDGTRAYISGIPVWSTLIGLYHHGKPHAGIMHQPFTGEKYICDGQSSFYLREGKKTPLGTSPERELSSAIMMATSPEMFSPQELGIFNRLAKQARMVRYGGDSYAYCQLAAGHVGLVVEADIKVYDVAALIPIVEKAGGVFTDWQGNAPGDTGQILAAANEALHGKALQLLNSA